MAVDGGIWPADGDRLFQRPVGPGRIVRLDQGEGCSRIEALGIGYFEAAERLVASVSEDARCAGRLAYPILFLYRQALELSLKQVVGAYGPAVGVAPIWSSHDLEKLWQAHAQVAQRLGAKQDPADAVVGELIREFAEADPASYHFRFPVDTKGQPIPVAHSGLRPLK